MYEWKEKECLEVNDFPQGAGVIRTNYACPLKVIH